MSRHRDVRNLEYHDDDFGDSDAEHYGSSYGGSYYDELSTSVEREFMFRRNQSGTTPKMSNFFDNFNRVPSVPEDEDVNKEAASAASAASSGDEDSFGGSRNLSRQNSYTGEDLSPADQLKLAECLEKILDIVGEAIPESIIKDAIVKCDYDHELTLNTVLNNPPTANRRQPAAAAAHVSTPRPAQPTISRTNPSKKHTIKIEEDFDQDFKIPPVPTIVTTTSLKTADKRSRTPSPAVSKQSSGRSTPKEAANNNSSILTPGKELKVPMRKTKVDIKGEYHKVQGEYYSGKDLLNLVVVGHVDSGKSTLMGHLLVNLGNVTSRAMHKYEQESRKLGKQSFCYAWVLDETTEERARGITMDVGVNKFETAHKIITLLDAPGHKDFIPKMISGAYQADVAILVVNATRGEFEAGFDAGGQTREHGLLVRSLGVLQLVVAVNKLDTVDWNQERFLEIKRKLEIFLKQIGFKSDDVTYVPCSGFTGDNLNIKASEKLQNWENADKIYSLLQAIDNFKSPQRLIEKPFRLSVSDVYKQEQTAGFSVSGRIESGYVQKDDKILVCPLNEIGVIKSVQVENSGATCGFAGDVVSCTLASGPDMTNVTPGMVICDPQAPIPVSKKFQARIVIFNIDVPITKGFPVVCHYGSVQIQAIIKKLISVMNKSTGEVTKSKPRCLLKNCNATVEIHSEAPICVELYSDIKELGRFMLRNGGKTIAAGLITKIL